MVGVDVTTRVGFCEGEIAGSNVEISGGRAVGVVVIGVLVCALLGAETGTEVVMSFGAVDGEGTGAVVLTPVHTGMEHAKSTQN